MTPVGDPPNVIIASNSYIIKGVRTKSHYFLSVPFPLLLLNLNFVLFSTGCKLPHFYRAYERWYSFGVSSDLFPHQIQIS